jgi:hypothetical protein
MTVSAFLLSKEAQPYQVARVIIDDRYAIDIANGGGFLLDQVDLPQLVGLATLEALQRTLLLTGPDIPDASATQDLPGRLATDLQLVPLFQ